MKETNSRQRALRSCAVTTLGLALALPLTVLPTAHATTDADANLAPVSSLQDALLSNSDGQKVSSNLDDAEGSVAVFVQFKGQGAYEATQPRSVLDGISDPVDTASQVRSIQSAVESQAAQVAGESGSDVIYTTYNSVRGVALQGDAESLRKLAERNDVERISRIIPKERVNGTSDIDTAALATWVNTGKTGKGVTISVVDTGVDYTHSAFGGPGTDEAYQEAQTMSEMPSADSGLYDPEKFIGGYDLAGDDYGGSGPTKNVPSPDGNPLDCAEAGHGSHVAGTAAAYGTNADGSTFDGDYSKLTSEDVQKMQIGPGSAPEAQIVGLRVFGCEGSTNLTGQALDRSLDPNGDGDYSDRVDIVNLSLGSDFGPIDDPDNIIMDSLYRNGVLTVTAAGNANGFGGQGDTYSVLGTPGNTISSLTVANTIGSKGYADGAEILAPTDIAGPVVGDYSVNFNYNTATEEQLTGEVVATTTENPYACDAYPAGTNFAGKWVFIDWSDETGNFPCGSAVRFNNIQKAGAKGVVLASQVVKEDSGIGGNAGIPGVRLTAQDAEKARPAAEAGTLKIKLDPEMIGAALLETGQHDNANPSTARGQHGSAGFTKPDVAAPGTSIKSVAAGGGTQPAVMTGTSMAAPHVAGIAALVLEAHPNYSPASLKAAIMNSANHDPKDLKGNTYSVERVGAGRVDALQAVNSDVLLYNADRAEQVSSSFGVTEVATGDVLTQTRNFTVDNRGDQDRTFAINFNDSSSLQGVELSAPANVTVAANSKATFTVTATTNGAELAKTRDPAQLEEHRGIARQYLATLSTRMILSDGGTTLRVPVQAAPKPVSEMKAEAIHFGATSAQEKVKLSGTALNQNGYVSGLGAFQLGAESARIPTGKLGQPSFQAVDLQYVGANSTILEFGGVQNGIPAGAMLNIGLSTWGNWETMTPSVAFEASIDVNNDGVPDFAAVTTRITGVDYPVVNLLRRMDNGSWSPVDSQPLNGALGDVDTNILDTNAAVLPISLNALNLTPAQAQSLSYKVHGIANGEVIESTDWIKYNPYNPALSFFSNQKLTDSLFIDAPDTEITAIRTSPDSTRALFLHMHNSTGDLSGIHKNVIGNKAQVVDVQNSPSAPTVRDPRFTDVPTDHPFFNEINWLATRGITTGWSDGTFRPNESVERGAMAAFFYRLAGSPAYTAPSESRFKDVPTDHPFYKEISWLAEQNITTGWSDGTFRPSEPVNRDAMAAFFYRMAGSPAYTAPNESPFNDVPTNRQFYKEISWLAEQNITNGWEDGTFRPKTPIERGAMAAFLYRYDATVLSQ